MFITSCDCCPISVRRQRWIKLEALDNNPKEDNLKDGVLLLEQLESVLLDDDDHVEMPPPSSGRVPMSRIPGTTLGASSSTPS